MEWPSDMAFDGGRSVMYQVNVGGDNSIYVLNGSGLVVTVITDPNGTWTVNSQRGLAYRSDTDTLYIGGWNDGIIYHIKGLSWDHPGEILNWFYPSNGDGFEWAISGLAWDGARNILWEASNSGLDTLYALNPDTGTVLRTVPHPDPGNNGAGLETDRDGNLWTLSQGGKRVYLINSGADVLWLTETPSTGTVPTGGSQSLQVTVNTTHLDPGVYNATLTLANNSGRAPQLAIPVSLTLNMAFIQGYVTDTNSGLPISGANVVAYTNGSPIRSLSTDAAGFYKMQVPLGAYVISVVADGYQSASAPLTASTLDATYTKNFALRTAHLQGHVTDANDGLPVVRALLRVQTNGILIRSLSTDAAGYYQTTVPPGQYRLEVSAEYYSTNTATLTVASRTTPYVQNFSLRTPRAQLDATALEFVVPLGQSRTKTLSLRNTGASNLVWNLYDSGGNPPAPPATAGNVLKTWPYPYSSQSLPWGVGYNGEVFISDYFDHVDRGFTTNGTGTGEVWSTPWAFGWAGDMAYDANRGVMYQVNIGGDNAVYVLNNLGAPIAKISDPNGTWTANPQLAVAYRPDDDTLYIGGWNNRIVYHVKGLNWDRPGEILNSFAPSGGNGSEWSITGLAWDPVLNILWESSSSLSDTLYALNPDTGVVLKTLPHPNPGYNGAGLEADEKGNLWMVSTGARRVYLVDAGRDVPWITETPASGALSAGGSQAIQVTVNASALQVGTYTATFCLLNNGGRTSRLTLPVTVIVTDYSTALNSGGNAYTDSQGQLWQADKAYTASGWGYAGTSAAVSSTVNVTATSDGTLYKTARSGAYEYRFDVPVAGTYEVELRFAEIQNRGPGQRVFDVVLEGTTVLPKFDIAAEVGVARADNHTFFTSVTDGQLNLRLVAQRNIPPLVNAIRVTRRPDK